MTTQTQAIAEELIRAVDDPAGLEAVLQQHRHSKGPLYLALAKATSVMSDRLNVTLNKCKEAQKEYQEQEQMMKTLEREIADKNSGIMARNKELASLDEKLKHKETLLDQAKALGELSFGPDELGRLHDLLVQVAASQGARPEEAIALFFQEVDRYGSIVSLELEAKRAAVTMSKAKAEAERWQAEAKAAEAKCKARKSSIDITDKLLAVGMKEVDIPHGRASSLKQALQLKIWQKLWNNLHPFRNCVRTSRNKRESWRGRPRN